MAHTSRSRVTRMEPCSTAPNPPTMTNSISASLRRWSSRLISITQLPASSFQFQRQRQRLLMLYGTLLRRAAQALVDEAQIETCQLCQFEWVHAPRRIHPERLGQQQLPRSLRARLADGNGVAIGIGESAIAHAVVAILQRMDHGHTRGADALAVRID